MSHTHLNIGYCPPLSNSWITFRVWLYIALNRTSSVDCYWVGAVPSLNIIPGARGEAQHLRQLSPGRSHVRAARTQCTALLATFGGNPSLAFASSFQQDNLADPRLYAILTESDLSGSV